MDLLTVEGQPNTKVCYVLRESTPRPFCYEVSTTASRSLEHSTALMEIGSDDDQALEDAMMKKKDKACAVLHECARARQTFYLSMLQDVAFGVWQG